MTMAVRVTTSRNGAKSPPRRARTTARLLGCVFAAGLAISGCGQGATDASTAATTQPAGADTPVDAVLLLTRHLRDNDLSAFARDATPPALQPALETAWGDGRSRWPLSELPLSAQFPTTLGGLTAPQSERILLQAFNRQFAGADRELRAAAQSLGVFAAQYLQQDPAASAGERAHYTQLVTAISDWAAGAPLSSRDHARTAIATLVPAARAAGLDSDAALGAAGMHASLQGLGPVIAAAKQALQSYGLDVDAALDSIESTLQVQTGDTAQVRMRYTLAGQPIDAIVDVERHDGRWFVSDFLRNAEAAAAAPAPTGDAVAPPVALPGSGR